MSEFEENRERDKVEFGGNECGKPAPYKLIWALKDGHQRHLFREKMRQHTQNMCALLDLPPHTYREYLLRKSPAAAPST